MRAADGCGEPVLAEVDARHRAGDMRTWRRQTGGLPALPSGWPTEDVDAARGAGARAGRAGPPAKRLKNGKFVNGRPPGVALATVT